MKVKICGKCNREYEVPDSDNRSKLCKSCKAGEYFSSKSIKCAICGNKFITQGNKKICYKKHYFKCSICGELIELKTMNEFDLSFGKDNINNIFIIKNNDEECVITGIFCPCLECRMKYVTNKKRAQSVKDTFMKRYGVSSPFELPGFQYRRLENYNMNKEEIIKKKLKTERENHGGRLAFHTEEAINKATK